jgi:hypothetical protein
METILRGGCLGKSSERWHYFPLAACGDSERHIDEVSYRKHRNNNNVKVKVVQSIHYSLPQFYDESIIPFPMSKVKCFFHFYMLSSDRF